MIRRLQSADINRVADIWLDTNLKAHDFIPGQYWKRNFELVKEMFAQAEVYVYEDGQKIQGFIRLSGEYIEGIFVSDEMQSQGIGKLLLNFIKAEKTRLCLNVYQKNVRAIHFYQKEGFEIQCEGLDEATGEKDYVMRWESRTMFRTIRKKKNEIDKNAAENLLQCSRRGTLAVNGDDGYPYAIPINYIYDSETQKIYFHGARAGHKVDALRACDKVCFSVYGNETIKEETWAPFMQSVVVFGRCHLVDAGEEATALLKRFAMKYYPDEQMVDEEIARAGKAAQLFEIEIEHLSGKEVQER